MKFEKQLNKFYRWKIESKINIFYVIVLLFSFLISYFLYSALTAREIEDKMSITANQTLQALDKNLEFILGDVAQFSNLIFFDKTVQSTLRSINSEGIDPEIQTVLNKYLVNMLLSGDFISSVYLYDNYNNQYSMGKQMAKQKLIQNIENADWYDEVKKLDGGLEWVLNSGGVLKPDKDHNFISLVRVINDVTSIKKLATLMVNVDENTIQDEFEDISERYKSEFFIMDSHGQYITHPKTISSPYEEYLVPLLNQDHGHIVKKIGGKKMLISFASSKYSNWKIVGVMPINELSKEIKAFTYIPIIIILLNCLFILIGAVYVSKLVTKPLIKMQHYMKKVQQGNFETIPLEKNRDDEIVQLKRGFNKMVVDINNLINKVKEEQKIIRKNELNLIQAQINPHFLYNTLDAISALSLLNDSDGTYKVSQALGNFYRNSLNSGKDIITVKEEIDCINNYVTILDIRYKGKFEVRYDIDENINSLEILKLILQPFVENSIHHGIRNKREKGFISIRGYRENDYIMFRITDDGIGMNENKISEILNKKIQGHKNGFGIYSSIERIEIFYNIKDSVCIWSKENEGTEITIKIPIMERD
jgi:two-component system sensor histidine kinase YesM